MARLLCRQDVGETAVDQFIDGNGVDVAALIHHQTELRQVLGGVPEDLQAALLDIEAAVMPRAAQRLVGGAVIQREALVGTQRAERDDVAIRPRSALDAGCPASAARPDCPRLDRRCPAAR